METLSCAPVRIERVEKPGAEWDAFVEATPGATLGHAAAWAEVLGKAYGLAPHYLAARGTDGALAGLLPLAEFRSLRGARELVSLPFLDAAGVLAPDGETEALLVTEALATARRLGARTVELRQLRPLTSLAAPPTSRVDLALPLPDDEEALWRSLPAKVRNQTRKAGREGLALAAPPVELLESFYEPYRVNMRDLGSPAHRRAFFAAAAAAFGPRLRFVVVADGERPVGGLVAIRYANAVTVPWASTLRSERSRCPNNLIYWEALRWAVAHKAQEFDFGRSPPESGTWRFKRGWGAEERPLAWARLDAEGRAEPAHSATDSRLVRGLARVWRRLPPPLCDALGPRLRGRLSS